MNRVKRGFNFEDRCIIFHVIHVEREIRIVFNDSIPFILLRDSEQPQIRPVIVLKL